MKRALGALAVLTLAVTAGSVAYQAAWRDKEYRTLLERGDRALRDEQTFGAIEAYSGAIALRPDSMLAHLRRGETYQRRGDLEDAARDLQNAAILDPAAIRPLEELADVRYLQQRFHRASEIYEQSLRLDDRVARVSYKLGLARYRDANIGGALTALAAALHLDDRMTDAYYLEGLCFRQLGNTADAQRAFEKAVALVPGLIPAHEELADLYAALGRRNDELEQLQFLAGLERTHVERQIAVGLAHARWAADPQESPSRRAGHADLAVLTLGSVLERAPDQPLIYGALGRVWLDIARARNDSVALNKASEALERIGLSNAATSEVLTLYGRSLLQGGRPEIAERTLRQATERYPIDPSAFLAYADVAEQLNHLREARQALLRYGALVTNDNQLAGRAARIAALSARLNDRDTALTWIARGLEREPTHAGLLALRRRLS